MIQFNLLPDVKLEYIKAERTRQTVITVSVIVSLVSLAIFLSFVGANVYQKKHVAQLTESVAKDRRTLESKRDINKILTVQNQIKSLSGLHDAKPAVSQIFGYLNQVTPDKIVSISSLKVDYLEGTISISGTSDSLASVNQFIDTLKFTTFRVKGDDPKAEAAKAFSNVVLTSFTYTTPLTTTNTTGPSPPATYTLDFAYTPDIFNITKVVTLNVPKDKATTRSEVDKPTDLFVPAPKTKNAGGVQ